MGSEYGYNEHYLMKDGKPWPTVMGEMHYSRYKEELWEESLRKLKAGGVSIVSFYVIWIHHEEQEGIFDFTGCRNLRKFLETCKKVGIKAFLRIGPWVHGEVRNGGFPDWLQAKGKSGMELRSNDPEYLTYVKRYWEKVFQQAEGFMEKDGGPVIGVQLENEYVAAGSRTREAGDAHMRTLMQMAKEMGFCVPFYTATGWGNACIGDCIPVMGGYCEAPWAQSVEELPANNNYIISHVRNDALIACDHHLENAVGFEEAKFPFLLAELGGGLQVTGHRRPVADGADIGAMSTTKLASGANLLGYYMYHGGSNPKGKLSTLQESRATGYANDLPEINYDANAPVRQYGTISDNYKEIKLLALFLKDFGEDIAPLEAEIPDESIKPEDTHSLRCSYRHDSTHGYVFFNNYQRRRTMDAHKGVVFEGPCGEASVVFPPVDLAGGAYGFFPYHMKLGEAVLQSALATPLCKLWGGESEEYVFYGDYEPQFTWAGDRRAKILHLNREQALNAWKVRLDRDYLILADNYVWEEDGRLKISGPAETKILVYPKLKESPEGFHAIGSDGCFTVYQRQISRRPVTVSYEESCQEEQKTVYELHICYPEDFDRGARSKGCDVLLWLDYAGYAMDVFMNGEKINDHFYTGQKVPISLGYFDFPEELTLCIKPLHQGEKVFLEKWPDMDNGCACRLESVRVQEEYR